MNYTKFGEYFKILRIKHHEVLADVSSFLGVSTAFVSAVECGKKQIPDEWKDKIVDHYKLNSKQEQELIDAIDLSKQSIKINMQNVSLDRKNLAIQFRRSFDNFDDETVKEILKIIERNKS